MAEAKKDDKKSGKNPKKFINLEPTAGDLMGRTVYEAPQTEGSRAVPSSDELQELAVVSLQQRRQRGLEMRKIQNRLKSARIRSERKRASEDKLKQRSRRKARMLLRGKYLGTKTFSNLSASEKLNIDRRLARVPEKVIDKLASRQIGGVRRAETARLARRNEESSIASDMTVSEMFSKMLSEGWTETGDYTHNIPALGQTVEFVLNSVYCDGEAASGQIRVGTVVGGDSSRLRVRSPEGRLFLVRVSDVI